MVALELPPDEFRRLGHELVDRVAEFLGSIRDRPLTSGETPAEIRDLLGRGPLPAGGTSAADLLPETTRLLFEHSLFNAHPRFMGYITSSAAPLGALADLLAATVNPNVGGWELSPMASEIEAQTVRWVAELVGYPETCGGLLVSGGNMANFVCFLAGRRAMLGDEVRAAGLAAAGGRRSGCTPPPAPTPGSRRRATSSAWAPTRSGGSPPTPRSACGRTRSGRRLPRTWRAGTGRCWWWAPPAA